MLFLQLRMPFPFIVPFPQRQEEKGTTEDEMIGWHYQLDGYEKGGKEQAKLTPSCTFSELDHGPGSHGDNIPMAELASRTDKHQIPHQDFPSPKRI